MKKPTRLRVTVVLASVLAGAAVIAAVATAGGPGAAASLAPLLKQQTSVGVTTPLSKKPAAGKKIYFLQCSQPVCTAFLGGLQAAAKVLGWTVQKAPFTQTPEGIQSAVQAAIDAKPDGIFFTGISPSLIGPQLANAKKAGIPIVDGFDVAPPKAPIAVMLGSAQAYGAIDKGIADWTAVDSGGKAHVLILNISAYTILEYGTKLFQKELARVCSTCKTTVLDSKPTDVGTALPAAIVSALQRDPSINYLAFSFGDMALGVANALKGAGLQKILPHMVSFGSASPSNLNDIIKGNFGATSAWSIPFNGWQAMDTFARIFNGDKIPATMPSLEGMVVTAKTAKSQYKGDTFWDFAGPVNYPAQFKKLWHEG